MRSVHDRERESEDNNFNAFKLSEVNWSNGERISTARTLLYFEGTLLELDSALEQVGHFEPSGEIVHQYFTFRIIKGSGEIVLNFEVTFLDEKSAVAEVDILRTDPKSELPKGIGMALFDKIPELIQKIANDHGVKITDYVEMVTALSDDPLSAEKWNKLFKPYLEKNHYENRIIDGEELFVKTYEPNVK